MKTSREHYNTWKKEKSVLEDPNRPSVKKLETVFRNFPDIPKEAVVKEDMLRSGIAFSVDALRISSGFKPKAYFIFSFDLDPVSEMKKDENLNSPEEIKISGGAYELLTTTISVRNNSKSPYLADIREGKLFLFLEEILLAEIELPDRPSYYNKILSNGKPFHEVTPTIEWGYLIYLTIYRQCQYWGKDEECLFCDINENYRQQKNAGRPYKTTKTVEEIMEALAILEEEEAKSWDSSGKNISGKNFNKTRAYTITGGSITGKLKGLKESEFYYQYARAVEEAFPKKWIGKVVLQALPKDELIPFKRAGIQIYHPNYEIWDERLFHLLCPGKERYVGRANWHRMILESREVFGQSNVIPNFVAGIEMAKPDGFREIKDALASTTEGLEFFMSHGVVPRYTVWCPEPLTVLGSHNFGAPLEYHARLLEAWRNTFEKYNLPVPPGYGRPGRGRAVFSVSAFMDAIRENDN